MLGLAGWSAVVEASSIAPVPGSPFTFPEGGRNANVVLLHPDGTRLFVANNYSSEITVLDVAADGSLSFLGKYPTVRGAYALAINPAGDRLYVTTGSAIVNVHGVAPDGSLSALQSVAPRIASNALNGIVYVPLADAGGAFDAVYVNNNVLAGNTVTRFAVAPDGLLSLVEVVATGGLGGDGGFFAASQVRALPAERRLYVVNGSAAAPGSNDISVFDIGPDGALAAIEGSPFPLPVGMETTGSIAVDGARRRLYAGTTAGSLVQYRIEPATGRLAGPKVFATGLSGLIDGIEVHPCAAVVAVTAASEGVAFVDGDSLRPFGESPVPATFGALPAGLDFDATGSLLFVGNANAALTGVAVLDTSPVRPTACHPGRP